MRLQLGAAAAPAALQLNAIVPTLELGRDSEGNLTRTIGGTITVYETPSSSQGIVVHDGSLQAREPLSRVKMLRDHNHGDPVGYCTSMDLAPDARRAEFYIPEDPQGNGDRALFEAENKLRDGLSIGFTVRQYAFDDDFNLHVYEAELYEVSLCAIPDFADAEVTDVAAAATTTERGTLMNREQLAAALAAGTITREVYDREVAKLALSAPGGNVTPLVPPGVDPALAAGPTQLPASTPVVEVRERALSLAEVRRRVTAAFATGDAAQIRLAIQDVVPADDAGTAWFGRDDWLGELWRATNFDRIWIDAIGPVGELTSLKWKGWFWDVLPKPGIYGGNKAEVPSNKPKTASTGGTAKRWAGGWDIDRAYVDFADEDYLNSFWAAATEQYQLDSDADIAEQMVAAAVAQTPLAANAPALAVIKGALRPTGLPRGAKINRMFLADDLYDEYLDTPSENLPLWLAKANVGVSPQEGTADVDQLYIRADSSLETGTAISFDNRAMQVLEKRIPQVKALDVAHGGIDLGFYSYGALKITDPRLIIEQSRAAS